MKRPLLNENNFYIDMPNFSSSMSGFFFEFARRGHELLTDEQIEKTEQIYHQEKDAFLKALLSSLNRAVAPHFQFVQTEQEWSDVSIEALRSMARVPSFG